MIQKLQAELISKKKLTENVYEFEFLCKNPGVIEYEAGQYMMLNIPKGLEKIKRLYSVFNFNEDKSKFIIVVKLIPDGIGSEYLTSLKEKDNVEFEGPAGMFLFNKNAKDKIFLATGTGIMPILSLIFSNVKNMKNKFILFWGLRKKSDIFYFNLLQQLAKNNKNFTFGIYISKEEIGQNKNDLYSGRINTGVDKLFSEKQINLINSEFYICGNKLNVDSLKNYLIEKGIKAEDIKMEKFG
jgi:CDP-4-dehydro-6-deoxyglucose reductase